MSRLLCCLRGRRHDMGAALSHPQEGDACDGGVPASPPTMADVIRERKKKAGGAGLGTLRRRIAAAARRPRESRPDRGCEHARFIRSVVSSWRLAEVFLLCERLEAGAALRDLVTQAELAREPAPALHADLRAALADRWWCDVELVGGGGGWATPAHRALLSARCTYFRHLLQQHAGSWRVPLEGAGASLSRAELQAVLRALYCGPERAQCGHCAKWERGMNSDAELDIISVENSTLRRGCSCSRRERVDAARMRRLAELLGFAPDDLLRDMRYLLDSRELCDARLSWSAEGEGGYGFRGAELPCHRLVLAARSRFFRSVMSRRCAGGSAGVGGGGSGAGVVCVDEKVLPRRFAPALLHAAYTDQVDLSLIGRNSSSPSSTNSASNNGTVRGGSRGSPLGMLEDAFQLYEIARFLEMPIVVQGCEDAIARALNADTLPLVLRWASAPHASAWLHRQAMRYLRDEFPTIMASPAAPRLPRAALSAALGSPFLQASETQALRALLRWAERNAPPDCREPNVVWHTAASASRRAARARARRLAGDAAVRECAAPLAPLLRLEHAPHNEPLMQAVRRGIVPALPEAHGTADAWLARGPHRPPRCFLPYLDELKALLEDQPVPEAELARARRQRQMHRIPDTLYMLAAAHDPADASMEEGGTTAGTTSTEGVRACVSARALAALRARVAELRASPPAVRALALHAPDTRPVRRQIALRAVREMSLPDACAELLLTDSDGDEDRVRGVVSGGGSVEWESRREGRDARCSARDELDDDCCRSASSSLRGAGCASEGRSGRRELPARPADVHHRGWSAARLSAAVPDVAMAPNANTHLLTARDYPHPPHHPPPAAAAPPAVHTSAASAARPPELGVLQLDLGDGATHTPRPGSRAQRAASQSARQHREHSQGISCVRRADDDELRAAIELSVIRAYSSLASTRRPHPADLLPPPDFAAIRSRATPSPSALSCGSAGNTRRRERQPSLSATSSTDSRRNLSAPSTSSGSMTLGTIGTGPSSLGPVPCNVPNGSVMQTGPPAMSLAASGIGTNTSGLGSGTSGLGSGTSGLGSGTSGLGVAGARSSASRSPSPRRSPYPFYTLYTHRDYRSEGSYGRGGCSRGHSPGYA